jgi:hypothetical protein
LFIANCIKLIKFQFPTPFLDAGKEMLILIICFDDVNKHKSVCSGGVEGRNALL